jgi:4-hydroxythreonine-4-phosphate dehydrogenase
MGTPLLIITPGDPGGIGPEITQKVIREKRYPKNIRLLIIGAPSPLEGDPSLLVTTLETLKEDLRRSRKHLFLPAPEQAPSGRNQAGFQSGWSVETAVSLLLKGVGSALVTGPISKENLQKGGYPYPGHTEFLAKLCGVSNVTMMLANSCLRVTLATVHVPLKDVSKKITPTRLEMTLAQTLQALKKDFGVLKPRIQICGLNPHAGENGVLGDEEITWIIPLIQKLKRRWARVADISGPYPADTLFAKHVLAKKKSRADAIIGLYHDQALIPVKLLDFAHTVNITLGLPIIRTSVDHGTGFDIAGKGIADCSSLSAAIFEAARMSKLRKKK